MSFLRASSVSKTEVLYTFGGMDSNMQQTCADAIDRATRSAPHAIGPLFVEEFTTTLFRNLSIAFNQRRIDLIVSSEADFDSVACLISTGTAGMFRTAEHRSIIVIVR